MKIFIALLTAMFAMSFVSSVDARKYKKKRVYHSSDSYNQRYQRRSYRRPYSVGPNGLCQRDTGTPTSELNFRVGCDVEEFWRRQEEIGGGIR